MGSYKLSVGLNTLNHLGINLYSNIPAVISEAVANSYDADAEKVLITLDTENKTIIIQDDGCGMSETDCNSKYLNVGYNKRETEGNLTPKFKRHVMGRKGIGKLSLFSISNTIEIHSVKETGETKQKNGFVMDVEYLKNKIKEGCRECPLPSIDIEKITIEKGTKVIMSNLKKDLSKTESFLRRRLARRFSVIGEEHNFSVILNETPIGVGDRDFFSKIEYIWYFGEYGKKCVEKCTNLSEKQEIDGTVNALKGYHISGWIGTVDERKSLDETNNNIIIQAWGKSIHDDILKDIHEGGLFTKYLIGEIRADFLDFDNFEDIATTDRQSVKEDDERYLQLKEFIQEKILKEIRNKWCDWRSKDAEKKALENEKIKEWFNSLKGDTKKYAQKLFMKIESFPIEDKEYKKQLYKHGILAFQTLVINENLSALDKIDTEKDFDMFTQLLSGMDQIEALHYYEIVKNRIGILNKFIDILPTEKEKVLQQYLFDHLWLLDPSWERADTVNKRIEESLLKEFENIHSKLTDEEKKARIDIRYKTAAGKHIIIELKKSDVNIDIDDLTKQIRKYRNALIKCLKEKFPDEENVIEIVCLLGSKPKNATQKEIEEQLKSIDARYITYDRLIEDTLNGYSDYIDKEKEINKIQKIIESI